jgi:hypothetical protein
MVQKFEEKLQHAMDADKKVRSCLDKIAQSLDEQAAAARRLEKIRIEASVALPLGVRGGRAFVRSSVRSLRCGRSFARSLARLFVCSFVRSSVLS